MYTLNLLITLFAWPIITRFVLPKLERQTALIMVSVMFLMGSVFAFLSTQKNITFIWNFFDLIFMHALFFSLYAFVRLFLKQWIYVGVNLIAIIGCFWMYNNLFGPSEACGQSFSVETEYLDNGLKITHCDYQYGYMDRGSRFIIYKTAWYGTEKIIGMAEDANQFYGSNLSLRFSPDKQSVVIGHKDKLRIKYSEKP